MNLCEENINESLLKGKRYYHFLLKEKARRRAQEYRFLHREEILKKAREKRKNHPLSEEERLKRNTYQKEFYHKNLDRKQEKQRKYYYDVSEEVRKKKRHEHYLLNREKILEIGKTWRRENLEQISKQQKEYVARKKREKPNFYKERYQLNKERNPMLRTQGNISSQVNKALKSRRIPKIQATFSTLPYSPLQLFSRLADTMPPDYSWRDYFDRTAYDPYKLTIDHIVAIDLWDIEHQGDLAFHLCWSLENLRLLPREKNISKQNKPDQAFEITLDLLSEKYMCDARNYLK